MKMNCGIFAKMAWTEPIPMRHIEGGVTFNVYPCWGKSVNIL